jgi:PA-IL-like protein
MKKILFALMILMIAASFAVADTIYLRDGRTVRGTLLGFVNGRFVVRVELRYSGYPSSTDTNIARGRRDEGEIQYFRPEEIDRIEIEGRSLDEARYDTRNVQVTLDSNWVDSGVWVRRNERVQVTATGVITVGRSRITPDGLRSTDPTAPLPNAPEGKLIGAIGDDPRAPIFELGSQREFTADRSGRLFLTANRGSFTDARGNFDVQIRRERNLTARDTTEDSDRGPGGIRSRNRDRDRDRDRRPGQEVTINVPGNSRGTDTGIDVRLGDSITFTATGTVTAGSRVGEVGPDGARSSGFGSVVNARPVPSAGVGALIAYIRLANGQLSTPYLIGSSLTTTVPQDGRLILAINDDNYGDNSGTFSVTIKY